MELLDNYQQVENQILDYFGYKQLHTKVYGFIDSRDCFWKTTKKGLVRFAKKRADIQCEMKVGHNDWRYFFPTVLTKCVYIGKDHTMISVYIKGGAGLQIFDNQKEIKETIIEEG